MSAMTRSVTLSDEAALARSAVQGNLDAFNELVLAYQELAYNHAFSLLGDAAQAEDITQDSLIKAYQKIGQFQGGSFRAWLLSIVTHTAYDWLRRVLRHPAVALNPQDDDGEELESPAWLVDPAPSIPALVEQREQSRTIQRMLGELPEAFRTVLVLVDVYGLDYAEVSQTLRVPTGTVKSRLARARMQMRKKLLDDEEPVYNFDRKLAVCFP